MMHYDDFYQGDTVTEDMGEEESDDIHEDCIDAEQLDM